MYIFFIYYIYNDIQYLLDCREKVGEYYIIQFLNVNICLIDVLNEQLRLFNVICNYVFYVVLLVFIRIYIISFFSLLLFEYRIKMVIVYNLLYVKIELLFR